MIEAISSEERRGILDGLVNSDEEVRRLAVEKILLLPIEEAAERLAESLGDSAWRVHKSAVERLVTCRLDTGIQEMLVNLLADGENPGRRNAAFEALVAFGSHVTERLVGELTSSDVDVRKMVIDALAAIGDTDSREPLRRAVDDVDPNVRAAAAEALGVVGGVDEIEHLLSITVSDPEDVLVRLPALRALCRMEASVSVASLGGALESSLLRPSAFELLGCSMDPQAAEVLLKGLENGNRSSCEGAMGALLRTLVRLDGAAADRFVERIREAAAFNLHLVETSCERLDSVDLERRVILIQFLGLLNDPRVVVPILKSGRDEAVEDLADATLQSLAELLPSALERVWNELDEDLKIRACALLARGSGDVADRLLGDALANGGIQLRCVAANAIGRGGFFDRLPELVRRLESSARTDDVESDEEVIAIGRAIVELAEHPEAAHTGIDVHLIEVLSSRLAGAAEPVRLAIAKVIGRLGRDQDQDIIGYLLKDESAAVRRAAVQALARFEFERATDALRLAMGDEASIVRIAAATVLGNSNRPEALEPLARQMGDEDPRVVAVATRSIGRLYRGQRGDPGEAKALIEHALSCEAMVALAAIEALMDMGGEIAAELVTQTLKRPEADVVRSGVACFGAFADLAALAEIQPLVAHPDWSVRAEAVQVFADRRYRAGLPALLRRLEVEDDPFVREVILRTVERLED